MTDDSAADFARETFTRRGTTHEILRSGSGPAVIVIAEIPGTTPRVLDFARKVRDLGCTVIIPVLFGRVGHDPNPDSAGLLGAAGAMARAGVTMCVSREFTLLATGRTSPVVPWLRDLAAAEHQRCGGPGVGAVGMCLTGGFALAMATDERVLAPVLAQPALPLGVTPWQQRAIDTSPEDLAVVAARCAAGLKVLGLRFRGDRLVPAARFAHLKRVLGDGFVAIELDAEDANPAGVMPPHSTLTEHLVDEPGTPTREALDQVLDLFRTRLLDPDPA
ncbi:dienelactone hydrolase family protein [Knoellia subterranea]|uniref:Dienelactone hydrolase n=1 Tax=Knoellia subterranea KCTC 19937 TaxID=1385521 RepID=A0A0A0JHA7_9MICO|nr:dienelactone hydrolase family protein [Knoellia subterranea]KGN36134.1 dienelactone hydrolase [Knoellia subterranea KCTC 19937]